MIYGDGQRTARENQEVRVRLTAMAEALEQRQEVLAAAWDSVHEEVVDEVERALQVSEANFSVALESAIGEARASIAHALAVLDAGGYGVCEECGSPIGKARLSFRPESTRCLQCQDLADRRGGASHELVYRTELTNRPHLVAHSDGDGGRIVSINRSQRGVRHDLALR
jgi:RNA polymerase-binding transcription factor